jgi:hypothetical protein
MFCPKCGQEQASESVRYCARCGFKLSAVEEPLAKRLIAMATYLILAIGAYAGWASITAGPGYMQIRVIITIIAAIAFYLLFARDLKRIFYKLSSRSIEEIKQVASATHESALPPAQNIPNPIPGPYRVNTAEMVQPPSITEHTTVLLEKKER